MGRTGQHGYPKEIADSGLTDKHVCEECRLILRDPVQGPCGHRFCRSCAERLWQTNIKGNIICPVCVKSGEDEPEYLSAKSVSPDHAVRRELERLKVHCVNPGCHWTGNLKSYEKHESSCPFRVVRCDCGRMIQADDLEKHRSRSCTSSFISIDSSNNPSFVMSSSFTGGSLAIEELVKKVSDLELQVQTATPGSHGNNIMTRIKQLEEQVVVLERRLGCAAGSSPDGQQYATLTDLEKYKQIIKFINHKIMTYESLSAVLNGEIHDMGVQLREMKEQIEETSKSCKEVEKKTKNIERVQALHDIRVSELEATTHNFTESTRYDGALYWKIDKWAQRTKDATDKKVVSLYSPPFFTGHFGYKMCMRLYPCGDGMGRETHLSLFFVVMKGPYDALLKWPFVQKVTMTMLDQSESKDDYSDSFTPDPNSSSFQRPTNEMNIASGCPKFFPLSSVEAKADKFLKGDTLFFKIAVDPNNIPQR